ncbi:F-box only protein 27 isoform X1 [Pongo pygmaeus]|nr:F-box only protein 27 isoform X1 [Pongo pygmaeus]
MKITMPNLKATAGPGGGTMGASVSRGRAARVPAPEPEPEEALDLSQLPPELLLVVLSHVPPRTLLGRCRQVCRGWRALVDGQALWLLILARDHGATGRALLHLARSCQSPARNARPCPLGRFCARRPIGRNLIRNPCGQEGLRKWMVQHGGDGWVVEENRTTVPGAPSQTCFVTSFSWCCKKQVLDLEEEGLWPELLDSGRIEICVSDWWGARHDSGCMYRLLVQLLDANQTVLDKFSAVPDPIPQWNNNACLHRHSFTMLPGLVLNSCAQAILPPQPPIVLGLQAQATASSPCMFLSASIPALRLTRTTPGNFPLLPKKNKKKHPVLPFQAAGLI